MSLSLVEVLRMEGIEATALFPASAEALLLRLRALRPNVVLLDLDLGPLGDGLDWVAPLTKTGAGVLILTGSHDELRYAACLEAGALGIIAKDADLDSLLDAIRLAARGLQVGAASERKRLLAALRLWRARQDRRLAPFRSLTARESEILEAIRHGMSVAVIAEELYIAPATARSHIHNILVKLGTTSQLEAVSLAREVGWDGR